MTITEIIQKKTELLKRSKTATVEQLKNIQKEMEGLNAELKKAQEDQQAELLRNQIAGAMDNGDYAGNPLDGVSKPKKAPIINAKTFASTPEYRQAFMDYVLEGKMDPMFRDVATTSNNGAVIPVPVLNEIVEKMMKYGNILPLVRHLNYPAGMTVPTSTLEAAAKWMTEGGSIAPDGKKTQSIAFAGYQLAAAVGLTFQAQIKSMAIFEQAMVQDVSKAMTIALEQAIISGDGSGKPTGITKATTPIAPLSVKDPDYKFLIKILKAIPSAYKSGSVLVMNESTFLDIAGITDTAGQPIAHVNYGIDGAPTARILGKPVAFTDFLPALDTAEAGNTVAFAFDLNKYILNVAYAMDLVSYIDNATRNRIFQSVGLYDGKVVDANGLVLINKAGA